MRKAFHDAVGGSIWMLGFVSGRDYTGLLRRLDGNGIRYVSLEIPRATGRLVLVPLDDYVSREDEIWQLWGAADATDDPSPDASVVDCDGNEGDAYTLIEFLSKPENLNSASEIESRFLPMVERKQRSALGLVSSTELFQRTPKQADEIVEGLLTAGQYGVVAAPTKHFKTLLSYGLAVSVATGRDFLGRAVKEPRQVLFFTDETLPVDLANFHRRYLKSIGLPENHEIPGLIAMAKGTGEFFDISCQQSLDRFERICKEYPGSLIIIDPLNHALGTLATQTANRSVISAALSKWSNVSVRNNVTLLINHHCNEGIWRGQVPQREHLSGAGVAEWCRFAWMLNRKANYNNGVLPMSFAVERNGAGRREYVLTVDEGPECDSFAATLQTPDEAKAAASVVRADDAAERARQVAGQIVAGMQADEQYSLRQMAELPGVGASRTSKTFEAAVDLLKSDGKIAEADGKFSLRSGGQAVAR